ncbi:MAG: hypothetical protein ABFS46_05495 [Myxococcota bacterium]
MPAGGRGLEGWIGPAALAVVFVALVGWSWGKWADVVIDFGAELYLPWRLSLGDALYSDIAYRHGPLSPHLNALLFRISTPSVETLVWANLTILAGLGVLVHRIFRTCCDRLTAAVVCLVLLTMFGFAHYVGIGNYNYVTPYQHSQTHGLLLCVAMILALCELLRRKSLGWAIVAGLCFGLVMLTKLEIQVPASGTALLAGLLLLASGPRADRGSPRLAGVFVAAALVPPWAAFGLLCTQLSPGVALDGLLGNWRYLGTLPADGFYLGGAGFDDPLGNGLLAVAAFLALALFAALSVALDRGLARSAHAGAWKLAVAACVYLGLLGAGAGIPWFGAARALPLVAALAAVGFTWSCLGERGSSKRFSQHAPLALWSLFSLLLLGKMLLRARFEHYGFVLAMPATLLLVALLVGVLPVHLRRRSGGGQVARAVALAGVLAAITFFLARTDAQYQRKTVAVGGRNDALLTDPVRGHPLQAVLDELEAQLPPEATLVSLPEGAAINFWLRRANPSRYYLYLPAEFSAFGEEVMLDDLRASAPDWVVLVDRPHEEFGVGPFGRDPRNGQQIMDWVHDHYDPVQRFGSEPFAGRGFGIALLRKAG